MIGSPKAHYRLAASALTASAMAGAMAVFLRRIERVEVAGDSMLPTLDPGDRLVVLRGRRPRPGDLVTVPDPRLPDRIVVKRVERVDCDTALGDMVVVRGDNPDASTDSRSFGPVPAASIGGRVVYRYLPVERRGRP